MIVKGPKLKTNVVFRMEDKGNVASIKFSPNMGILAIRRKDRSVIDFIYFKNGQPIVPEFSQTFKAKNTKFQEFYWLDSNDILLISEQGFEHYQIFPEKKALKLVRYVSVQLNWLIWSQEAQVFIVSTGAYGSILNPYMFSKGEFIKLPKFEVDLPLPANMIKYRYAADAQANQAARYFLHESDVVVGKIYNEFYVMIIRQISYGPSADSKKPLTAELAKSQSKNSLNTGYSEIAMYRLLTDSPAKKTNILKINLSDRFTLNIIDELIVVHHRNSYSSLIFDIKLPGEFDGYTTCNYPVIKKASIQASDWALRNADTILDSSNRSSPASSSTSPHPSEMYSMTWIMFLPNIIIDARLGSLWYIELNLKEPDLRPFNEFGNDYLKLVEFLLNRKNTKQHVLKVCKLAIMQRTSLKTIGKIFDKINDFYAFWLKIFPTNTTGSPNSSQSNEPNNALRTIAAEERTERDNLPIIEQLEMHNLLFYPMLEDENWWTCNAKYTVSLIVEYFRSLNVFSISIEHYLYKLLVSALIKTNNLYKLHQYLQYHVLTDSKTLACMLLSLEETYSATHQLALDMLKRLNTANEEIVDVLLSKGLILSALRFANEKSFADNLNPAKFLETAKDQNDPFVYYEVFKFFEERNLRLRNNPSFRKDENCEAYVQHFMSLFKNATTKVN